MALKVIEDKKLFFVEDIVSFMPIGKTTFYKKKLNEVDAIKSGIEKNKVYAKVQLRAKWFGSDNASLQLALYKLIADEDERRRLAMEYREHSTEKPLDINIRLVKAENGRPKK